MRHRQLVWTVTGIGLSLAIGGLVSAAFLGCSNDSSTVPPAPDTVSVPKVDPDAPGYFADVTEKSGIKHTYRTGEDKGHFAILESLGGGIGLIDYDQDGLLDVFVTGGGDFGPNKEILGHPNRLFRNEGNWRFRDVTVEVGLPREGLFYSHGCAIGDYNNDSWPDLLVTGYGRLAFYRNNKGKFEEVTAAAGVPAKPTTWNPTTKVGHWSTSAAWCDFNGDGHLDLYVEHYTNWSFDNHPKCGGANGEDHDVCSPKQFEGLPDQLFFNNGNGTFRDVSKTAGLRQEGPGHDKGLGVLVVDVNDDGRPDIYVANDTTDNYLYLNLGGGKFEEVGKKTYCAAGEGGTPNGSMGVAAADYDGSGRFSIFVTNYQNESHALYRNVGNTFNVHTNPAGINAIGLMYVGFGTGFIDYDRDGAEDIFITNGHVVRYPPTGGTLLQRPVLLRNLRTPGQKSYQVRFTNVTDQAGPFFHRPHMGRGVAFGDLDNDGRTDMVINHSNEPVAVLRNEVKNDNHWLGVELVGKPNRDAVGAKLTLEVGGQKLVRGIMGGGSYLSAHDLRVIFGLGTEQKSGKLTVRWPSGKTQSWDNLAIDRYWRLVEGEEKAQEPRSRRSSIAGDNR